MKPYINRSILFALVLFFSGACESLDTVNENNPSRDEVLTSGADLTDVLRGGYLAWWQGIHGSHPVIALGVTSDTYGLSWEDFGAFRMGREPRAFYNNRMSEEQDYQQIVRAPWFGCHSAVSSANDVLSALDRGVNIDNGGPQDESLRAAAHFLRGVSWGYLALIFDKALLVDEQSDLNEPLAFTPYPQMVDAAVAELETAILLTESVGSEFIHLYFNGLSLREQEFEQLSHAYAARFLAQWPRTREENNTADWNAVLDHAAMGLDYDFAPMADGGSWQSYQQYAFAETGQGPFWARVDQRLIAAMDPSQPARYPEVAAKGEPPLDNPRASSDDRRLNTDFLYFPDNNFPVDRGEWHFSHYKHNRNKTDAGFAGNGSSDGPMPAFLAADNELLRAEALLRLGRTGDAIAVINAGTRVSRGQLPALPDGAGPGAVEQAVFYERAIELLNTAPMSLWFDRRRLAPRENYLEVTPLGGLQTGTPAQLPVPAGELNIQMEEPYNFGGANDPMGINPVF